MKKINATTKKVANTVHKYGYYDYMNLEELDNPDDYVEEAKFKSKRKYGHKDDDEVILFDEYVY